MKNKGRFRLVLLIASLKISASSDFFVGKNWRLPDAIGPLKIYFHCLNKDTSLRASLFAFSEAIFKEITSSARTEMSRPPRKDMAVKACLFRLK